MKVFCPNCEKETECEFCAELYECKECGEDFAKYIVGRRTDLDRKISVDVKRDLSDAEIEELGARDAENRNEANE